MVVFSALATGHPGHGGLAEEIAEMSAYLRHNPRNLDHCASKLQARGIPNRSLARRMAAVQELQDNVKRKKRSLRSRQTASTVVLPGSHSFEGGAMPSGGSGGISRQNLSDFGAHVFNISHLSTLNVFPNMTGVTTMIFGNNSFILNPEGEVGPYYVQGEYVRSDITDDDPGVALYLDQQYIDVTTCEPIVDLYADIWHCNSTGVYAGVVAMGNGDQNDASNINATFLRGIQKTDGVVYWETIYPGYCQGCTTYIHMVTHMGATELSNGTITGGNITHVGQLMFDQSFTDKINANAYPYTINNQTITQNDEDSVFIAETLTDSGPFVNYV